MMPQSSFISLLCHLVCLKKQEEKEFYNVSDKLYHKCYLCSVVDSFGVKENGETFTGRLFKVNSVFSEFNKSKIKKASS